jgi:hypothetical protein
LIVLALRALERLTVFLLFVFFENRFSFGFVVEKTSKEGKEFSETLKEVFRRLGYSRVDLIWALNYGLLVIH